MSETTAECYECSADVVLRPFDREQIKQSQRCNDCGAQLLFSKLPSLRLFIGRWRERRRREECFACGHVTAVAEVTEGIPILAPSKRSALSICKSVEWASRFDPGKLSIRPIVEADFTDELLADNPWRPLFIDNEYAESELFYEYGTRVVVKETVEWWRELARKQAAGERFYRQHWE